MTNAQLKRLINKIEVGKKGNVDIYLRLIGDLGLDETVLIEGDESIEGKDVKAALNCHNHT
jgi:site-specific DNA recombinase